MDYFAPSGLVWKDAGTTPGRCPGLSYFALSGRSGTGSHSAKDRSSPPPILSRTRHVALAAGPAPVRVAAQARPLPTPAAPALFEPLSAGAAPGYHRGRSPVRRRRRDARRKRA